MLVGSHLRSDVGHITFSGSEATWKLDKSDAPSGLRSPRSARVTQFLAKEHRPAKEHVEKSGID